MMLLADVAIRSSVLLAAGLLLAACLARRSAAVRHRVLAASLVSAAAVVPFTAALPEWTVTLPARPTAAAPEAIATAIVDAPADAAVAEPPLVSATVSPIVLVWLAGVLATTGVLLAGLVRVNRLAARAVRVRDERWLSIRDAVAARYGLAREVALARTESAELLATWGVLRPQVLLPRHARDWTPERVHVVLCHEMAHVRRHDWLVQMGAETLRAMLWFNPLAWIVCTRLRRESEQACDDEVLGAGVGGHDYATHLINLAKQCRRRAWTPALPMAHPSTLERRIAAMLNPRLDRRPPTRRALALLAAALMLVTIPTAALRARQAGPAPLAGTIFDPSGGVLPGVEVTLVDANELTSVVSSDAAGRFQFPRVSPGKYALRFSLPGFRALRHEFELRSAPDWDRAFILQIGEVQESVTVRTSRASAPKQAKTAGSPVRVGGNIKPPTKVKDVKPVYPASMREAGLTGVVPIEAIIGRDGAVSSVRVVSAQVHPDFAVAAADAVRQWIFTPTLLNGEAVEVVMTVRVRFDLEG
jgi:TonB family protein